MEKAMAEVERFQLSGDAAQRYEQATIPTIMKFHTAVVFDKVPLHEGDRVLDVACGTGIVTRTAVEQFPNIASIVGVDLNPNMLDIARAHTPETTIPVEWREGDICALPFPDASFDVALCQQGLQYVPDKLAALRELKRVLALGGRLAFTVWSTPHRHGAALADALRRHVNEEAATRMLAASAWNDAESIRKSVVNAGFHTIDMEIIESKSRLLSSADSVRSYIEGRVSRFLSAHEIEESLIALEQEVSATLQPYRVGDEFIMPSKAHLVQARAS
jgi:ubiquinone/menaquinone biosynthesis C-methylase UbiE